MTELLMRAFVKNYRDRENTKVRGAIGVLSGIVGIICNAVLCGGKLIVGGLSGSVSIMADAVNNLSDATSSVVTLVGFRLSEIPPDETHPYGHARFEYLSGLAVAAMIFLIGAEMVKSSFEKILHPQAIRFSIPLLAVLLVSVAVKLWLAVFNRKLGKYIDSMPLLATAADSRNDALSTAAVLGAVLTEQFTSIRIDGYMGFAVAGIILYSGVSLARDTISPLLGQSASPELQRQIVSIVEAEPLVLGYHDLMVHDYGPGQRFGSIHVEMDHRQDSMLCHEIIDDMERLCLEKYRVHLVIHFDPVITGDKELDALRHLVEQAMTGIDSRLRLHDFRMIKGNTHTNLVFDIVLPQDIKDRKKDIQQAIDCALEDLHREKFYTVITFDLEAFNRI